MARKCIEVRSDYTKAIKRKRKELKKRVANLEEKVQNQQLTIDISSITESLNQKIQEYLSK